MAKQKQIKFTEMDANIVNVLKNAEGPLTLAQMSELAGVEIKSGHIVSAMRKGLIAKGDEQEIYRPATKEVNTYVFVTDEVAVRPSLKEGVAGKPYSYSETELNILGVLKDADAPMTLNDIAAALGVEKISSGAINALVTRKGNVAKGEPVTVDYLRKDHVNTYVFLADIPADAE